MADLSSLLMPTVPVDVETRKRVFFSISRQGARQALVKSGGIRFYELNFQRRPLAEYEDLRDQWEIHYPNIVFQWSNDPLDADGSDYYFDNNLTYTVNHPNNLDYKVSVRRKSAIVISDPGTNVIPHQPNFAEEIDELIRARIDDAPSYVRASAAIAPNAKTYRLKFIDRTMDELLEMENFWAYHYPTRQVVFNDLVLDLSGQLFYIDSDFKWQIERQNSINYSFLIVAVPSGITPYSLMSRAGFDTLSMSDSVKVALSTLSLNLSDVIVLSDSLSMQGNSSGTNFSESIAFMSDSLQIAYGLSIRDSLLMQDLFQFGFDGTISSNLQLQFVDESLNNWQETISIIRTSNSIALSDALALSDTITSDRSATALQVSDNAGTLADNVQVRGAIIPLQLSDTINNLLDNVQRRLVYRLQFGDSDVANSLKDAFQKLRRPLPDDGDLLLLENGDILLLETGDFFLTEDGND